MRFFNTFVRGTVVGTVRDCEIESLARLLVDQPVEAVLTGQGASRGGQTQAEGRSAAAALARRNIRSLLTRNPSALQVADALKQALSARPRDAEDALEDAGLEFNLRHCIFAAPDAVLRIENNELLIADDRAPTVRLPRAELRDRGAKHFSPASLARLVSLEVSAIRLSESAVLPLALQREPGALMEPDTAHERLHKGAWRAARVPHFVKEYCITCARCFIHCPDNAVVHAMFEKSARDSSGILGIDSDRCTACGLCASVCPADRNGYKAIVMIPAGAEPGLEVHHVA